MAKEEEVKGLEVIELELKPLATEMATLKELAESFVIANDDDYAKASELGAQANDKKKAIDTMRKFFTDPLNQQVKSINAVFNPQIDEADVVSKLFKNKMSVYFTEKEEARIKEEKRLEDIREKANAKRAEQGKEAITTPVREVAEVKKTVTTDKVQSQVRKTWSHEILSMNDLPEDIKKAIFAEAYKKGIVTTVVQKFVDAGMREISGVKIFEKATIAFGKSR